MNTAVWIVIAIVVIAIVGFVVLRRRGAAGGDAASPEPETAPARPSAPVEAPQADDRPEPGRPDPGEEQAATPDRAAEPARAADPALSSLDSGLVGRTAASGAGGAGSAEATGTVRAEPGAGAPAGSMPPGLDGSPPDPDYTIKANDGSRRYHDPSSPFYVRTRADLWFRDGEDAAAAGYRYWKG